MPPFRSRLIPLLALPDIEILCKNAEYDAMPGRHLMGSLEIGGRL